MRRAVLIAAGAWALLAAPSAIAAPELDAGALRAEVGADPWRLELTDAHGRPVLSERASTSRRRGGHARLSHRGRLGSTRPGCLSAKRGERSYAATLATTDPARTIEIRLARDADGVIALEAEVKGSGAGDRGDRDRLRRPRGRALPGLRRALERRRPERQRGRELRLRRPLPGRGVSADQPLRADLGAARRAPRVDLLPGSVAALDRRLRGARRRPADELLPPAHRRSGCLERRGRRGPRPTSSGAPAAAVTGQVGFRFFAGPKPADALRRFTEATGRQPKPAAPWLLGPWYQADDDEQAEVAQLQRGRRAALGAADLHPLPALRRPGRQRGRDRAARRRRPRRRDRDHHLLQPDDLQRPTSRPTTRPRLPVR